MVCAKRELTFKGVLDLIRNRRNNTETTSSKLLGHYPVVSFAKVFVNKFV